MAARTREEAMAARTREEAMAARTRGVKEFFLQLAIE
jgi:hypothetical protein